MAKLKTILFIALTILLATACKSDKKQGDSLYSDLEENQNEVHTRADGAQRMQTSHVKTEIKWKGKDYLTTITRTPDEALSKVTAENGTPFVDNKIVLTITCGGKPFFNKTFTKADFASVVDASFLRKAILEGLVYNKTTPNAIVFAASVCYPQTDLYIPLAISISADGKMTIRKDELLEEIYESEGL